MSLEKQIKERLREELDAKLGMWSKLPYSLLGIMGEEFGYSRAICKQRAAQTLREYDVESRRAGRSRLHRVASRFLAPGSEFRCMVEAWIASQSPLQDFAALYNEVLLYCLLPVVGRIVEGEHAKIKRHMVGRGSRLPGSINAAMRSNEADRLLSDPIFFGWCEALWKKRNAFRSILDFKMPLAQSVRLPWREFLGKVYLYDQSEQYRDVREESQALATWSKHAEPLLRVPPAQHPLNMRLVVTFVKQRMASGRIFSMPADLLEHALKSSGDHDQGAFAIEVQGQDTVALHDAFVGVVGTAKVEPDFSMPQAFFEVVNAHPERRQLIVPGYEQRNAAVVMVVCYRHKEADPGTFLLASDSCAPAKLDLSRISSMQLLSGLFAWRHVRVDSSLALAPVVQSRAMALDTLLQAGSAPSMDAASLHVAETLVAELAFVEDDNFVLVSALGDMDYVALDCLAANGVVTIRPDEFGESSVALHRRQIRWRPGLSVAGSQNEVLSTPLDAGSLHVEPKLALLAKLALSGWVAGDDPLAPMTPAGALKYSRHCLSRSKWYMQALLLHERAFECGAPCIVHAMPEAYYMVLLQLGALHELSELGDLTTYSNDHWRAALKSGTLEVMREGRMLDAGEADVGDPLPIEEGGFEDVGEDAPVLPAIDLSLLTGMDAMADLMTPMTINAFGHETVVKFDGFSHSSGLQRAYVSCKALGHTACFKYFTLAARPRKWAACYLHLWRIKGLALPSKPEHRDTVFPEDFEVDELCRNV